MKSSLHNNNCKYLSVMIVKVKYDNSGLNNEQKEVIHEFIRFIQKDEPLTQDFQIIFLGERVGHMTTGSRTDNHTLKILSQGRMLIDVLRTLIHEWTHEYQHQKFNDIFKKEIGGKSENYANIKAGILLKKFQKEFPQFLGVIYQ